MQTSRKIRPAARWHDGAPFTSDDLVFTAALVQDPQLLLLREPRFRFVESAPRGGDPGERIAGDQRKVHVRGRELLAAGGCGREAHGGGAAADGLGRRQYEATWPGFTLIRSSNDVAGFLPLHSAEARLPENAYNGSNRGRYMSRELDGLIDRYFLTIPVSDRVEIVGQIIHHVSDQLPLLPLFYGAEPAAIAHRLSNVGSRPPGSTQAWKRPRVECDAGWLDGAPAME